MTAKEVLRQLLGRLPDDTTFEDVQYQIYVLQKLRAGDHSGCPSQEDRHSEEVVEIAPGIAVDLTVRFGRPVV